MTDEAAPPLTLSLRHRLARVLSFAGVIALMGGGLSPVAAGQSAYDFAFTTIDGQPMPLSEFKGKTLLIVNTASFCGFTNQYTGLQQLYDRFKDRGFVVIGVPSNDFGQQEPGTATEIKTFCETSFDITFPLTDKVVVTGREAHPFYRWAGDELGSAAKPRWNFHKYLVSADGKLVDWFSTITGPTSSRVIEAIEHALPAPQKADAALEPVAAASH